MIALIAAMANNRVIGNAGKIPWHIPGEQRRFKELTWGHTVIMGRRTFAEIGKPLPGRQTVVLSKDPAFAPAGCLRAASLTEAIALAGGGDIFIAGGAGVYAEALPLCDRLYLTEIGAAFAGDTLFPDFDETAYEKITEETVEGEIPYRYVTYIRR